MTCITGAALVALPASIRSRVEAIETQLAGNVGFAMAIVSYPNTLPTEGGITVLPDDTFVVVESDGTLQPQSVMLPTSVFSETSDVVIAVLNGTGKRLVVKARADDMVNGSIGVADYVVLAGQTAILALIGSKEWVVTGLRPSVVEVDSLVD